MCIFLVCYYSLVPIFKQGVARNERYVVYLYILGEMTV